jgi:hypothetical protein
MLDVGVKRSICVFLFSFLIVTGVFAQTAAQGTLSPGFQACETPVKLDDFYGLRGSGWKVAWVSIQGSYLLGIIRPTSGNMERYGVWVQNMGSDDTLDPSDFNNNQLTYIHTFPKMPLSAKISASGMLAFILEDPFATPRTFPDPNWVWTTVTPNQPTIEVMPDSILYTCFAPACAQTIREVKRFTPTSHVAYTSPAGVNFMLDGSITQFHWDEQSSGLAELVYSYVQFENPIKYYPPWLMGAPAVPTPPYIPPHTAIERFEPMSGVSTTLAYRPTNGGLDGSSYTLSKTLQSPYPGTQQNEFMAVFSTGSMSLSGGTYLMEFFKFAPDTTYSAPFPYVETSLTDWMDGPQSGTWSGGWMSDYTRATLGMSQSIANPSETVAIRTRRETNLVSSQLRDLVFRSSLNNFTGPDIPISPVDDLREVNGIWLMDHHTPQLPMGQRALLAAVETQPAYNHNQKRTQIYKYQPSLTPGQVGTFAPYKEVLVQGGGAQTYWNWGAGGSYVYGLLDTYIPAPQSRDWAVIRCP